MIKCPNCARDNADNFNFCLDCGYDLKALREAFSPSTQAPQSPPPPPPKAAHAGDLAPPPASMVPPPVTAIPPAQPAQPSSSVVPAAANAPPAPWPPAAPPTATAPPTLPPYAQARPPASPPSPVTIPPASALAPTALAQTADVAAATMSPPMAPPMSPPMAPPIASTPAHVPTTIAPHTATAPPATSGILCPACGFQNAPGVRFCGDCGKRLDGALPVTAPPRTMFMHAASDLPAVREPVCRLVTIDQTGREGMTFTLRSGETVCGRTNGVILFDDPFVSPTHCRFAFSAGKLHVHDQGSLNGVYLRVRGDRVLADGDYLRVGRQLFRFESLASAALQVQKAEGDDSQVWGSPHPAAFGRLLQVLDDGRTGEIRLLSGERCQVGRENGDIVIPSDGFISGKHCVFLRQGPDTVLQDLGSSNGTYLRVRGEAEVTHGDFLLVGNQMLRVEIV